MCCAPHLRIKYYRYVTNATFFRMPCFEMRTLIHMVIFQLFDEIVKNAFRKETRIAFHIAKGIFKSHHPV